MYLHLRSILKETVAADNFYRHDLQQTQCLCYVTLRRENVSLLILSC